MQLKHELSQATCLENVHVLNKQAGLLTSASPDLHCCHLRAAHARVSDMSDLKKSENNCLATECNIGLAWMA